MDFSYTDIFVISKNIKNENLLVNHTTLFDGHVPYMTVKMCCEIVFVYIKLTCHFTFNYGQYCVTDGQIFFFKSLLNN